MLWCGLILLSWDQRGQLGTKDPWVHLLQKALCFLKFSSQDLKSSVAPSAIVRCLSSPRAVTVFFLLALRPNVGSGWQWWIFCIHTKHTKGPDKGRINNKENSQKRGEEKSCDGEDEDQQLRSFDTAWRDFWKAVFVLLWSINQERQALHVCFTILDCCSRSHIGQENTAAAHA